MKKTPFVSGFLAMLPIITGTIPFGAVMGTVAASSGLSFWQSFGMNVFVYAGAAQLAVTDLMSRHAAGLVVVATGLIINARFILYSAALSPILRHRSWPLKVLCAHTLTDQGYAVMAAQHDELPNDGLRIQFYLGTATCMLLAWHLSVTAGYVFGNFAPAKWSLDFAGPLSFAALVVPTLRSRVHIATAGFAAVTAILLNGLPYRTGLIVTAVLSISFAAILTRKRKTTND